MGELARKPGCPELADTPLGLLTPRPGEGFNIVERWLVPVVGSTCGVALVAVANASFLKRPAWSGIHRHVIAGVAGYYIGLFIQKTKFQSRMQRDAVLRHYITLHPDDFPPFERKRFGEIYYPFKPIR